MTGSKSLLDTPSRGSGVAKLQYIGKTYQDIHERIKNIVVKPSLYCFLNLIQE